MHRDRAAADLLVLSAATRFEQDGRYLDRYTDPWLEGFTGTYTAWEDHIRWRHLPHTEPRLFYLDDLHLRGWLWQSLRRLDGPGLSRLARALAEWSEALGIIVDPARLRRILFTVAGLYLANADRLHQKLRRKRPRLVVLVNHYDPVKMLIVYLAKQLGVYTVELQHGNMGRYHIGYNFGHRQRLPTLPDEILTFGRFWNETSGVVQNGVKLTAVGFPFFEERLRRLPPPDVHQRRRILILSQEAIASHLAAVAVKLVRELDPKRYEVIYKLHPMEYADWRTTYPPEFVRASITVLDNVDLYRWLSQTDVHVGVYSTTIIESLAFNKPLILLEAYGVHYLTDLIRQGRAAFARNPGDVLEIVQTLTDTETPDFDVGYFWEPDSRTKLLGRLQALLE